MIFPPVRPEPARLNALLWLVPVAVLVSALLPGKPGTPAGVKLFLVVLALGLAVLFLLAPRALKYEFMPDRLRIRKLVGSIDLPYATLSVRRSTGQLTVRTFGVGLPGYLTGYFLLSGDERGTGSVQACASTGTGGILLHTGKQAYFVTPADPDAFLAELARRGATVKD